ncbi:MAG: cyclic nucleotide-binding domain-containing protein, partial [Stellaceae bacterium]
MPRGGDENQWIALIAKVAPFSYLSEDELVAVADSFTWFTALGGRTLMRQGDPSDDMCIVVSGALGVYLQTETAGERFIARIGAGETVGEMGLISGEPRSATIRCLRDAELLAIGKADWDAFAAQHPGAFLAITQTLITRLRLANKDPTPKP